MKKSTKKGTKKKPRGPKASLVKLSNKRLNCLAKQGKLKPKRSHEKKKVLRIINERVHPDQQRHLVTDDVAPPEPEDIPLAEADYEYYARPGRNLDFLSDRSLQKDKADPSKRKRKRDKHSEEVEDYEKKPRKVVGAAKEVKALLPIKSREKGIIARVEEVDTQQEEEPDEPMEDQPSESAEPSSPKKQLPPLSMADILLQRQAKLADRKEKIAVLASTIIEQPQEGMRKLKELRGFLAEKDPDLIVTVQKLAMISILEVFKDIIPGYRVRAATEKEKSQQMKKETAQLRDFETSLLTNYRLYLEYLEVTAKGKPKKKSKKHADKPKTNGCILPVQATTALREVAVRCLCELLVTHPHFNYRTNIITVVIPYVTHGNLKISDMVCGHVKKLFREDKSGEVTLEVVRLIGRIIKARHFEVKPKVLQLFLALKIKEINKDQSQDNKAARRANMRKMSKREKKRHQEVVALEKELEESSLADRKKHKLRLHTEIISMVFLTYFRILKNERHSVLLSAVLEGLAKFAHLINVDFFDDLFAVLNDLVDSESLTYRESLHCVQTAFTILSGQGASLNIDPMKFYTHLYRTLPQLHAGISSEDIPIALKCLDIMINRRKKQVSQQRLLAYLKRLVTLSLQMEAHSSLASLATARAFIHANPRSDILLDTDCQGSGAFLPELDQPEHCNAHNTALYELHTLRRHYHPSVRQYGHHVMLGAPSQGQGALPMKIGRKLPLDLYAEFDSSKMIFNPTIKEKPQAKMKQKKVTGSSALLQSKLHTLVTKTEAKVNLESLSKMDLTKCIHNKQAPMQPKSRKSDRVNPKKKSTKR